MATTAALIAASGSFAGAWKALGGSSIFFHSFKTLLLGRTIRTLEYSVVAEREGEYRTITTRALTLWHLRRAIARSLKHTCVETYPGATRPLEESDISEMAVWIPPGFTEHVRTRRDLRIIGDGAWLLWSREDVSIPARVTDLLAASRPATRDDAKSDASNRADPASTGDMQWTLEMIRRVSAGGETRETLSAAEEAKLVQLALQDDERLNALARTFWPHPNRFRSHAVEFVSAVDGKSNASERTSSTDPPSESISDAASGTTRK